MKHTCSPPVIGIFIVSVHRARVMRAEPSDTYDLVTMLLASLAVAVIVALTILWFARATDSSGTSERPTAASITS